MPRLPASAPLLRSNLLAFLATVSALPFPHGVHAYVAPPLPLLDRKLPSYGSNPPPPPPPPPPPAPLPSDRTPLLQPPCSLTFPSQDLVLQEKPAALPPTLTEHRTC